jgi:hypothetical protein
MAEPIEIIPGVYTKPGERGVAGLCIMIDKQEAEWEVTTSDDYAIVIKIKKDAKWKVQEYSDPKTGKRKLQIFREGAKLNGLAQQFVHATEDAYPHNASAAKGEGPELKIYYTIPEDNHKPPIKKP